MNSRQLKHQLYAAVVMVLIGLVALSSATYAWFANSNTVNANNIKITAQADGSSVEITATTVAGVPSFASGSTIASLGLNSSTTIRMHPVHPSIDNTIGSNRISWGHAFSHDYDDANSDEDLTILALTPDLENHVLKESDGKTYALVADFYIRLNPMSSDSTITLTDIIAKNVEITDNSPAGKTNLLTKCVYLVVESEEGAFQIANGAAIDSDNPFVAQTESSVLIETLTTDDEYKKIRVYAFFDGQDKDCKSSQFSTENISIAVSFEGTPAHR